MSHFKIKQKQKFTVHKSIILNTYLLIIFFCFVKTLNVITKTAPDTNNPRTSGNLERKSPTVTR